MTGPPTGPYGQPIPPATASYPPPKPYGAPQMISGHCDPQPVSMRQQPGMPQGGMPQGGMQQAGMQQPGMQQPGMHTMFQAMPMPMQQACSNPPPPPPPPLLPFLIPRAALLVSVWLQRRDGGARACGRARGH